MPEPTLVTIEVSGGICHYEVEDNGHPVIVRFKDHDNIEAGDPDKWFYRIYNTTSFDAD